MFLNSLEHERIIVTVKVNNLHHQLFPLLYLKVRGINIYYVQDSSFSKYFQCTFTLSGKNNTTLLTYVS